MSDREIKNILDLEMDEILSGIPVKPAEILNLFSPRFFSFLNLALLDSPDRISVKSLSN
jgi:hypothetical protein